MKSRYGITDKYIYAGYVVAQYNNARSFAYLKKLIPNWVEENHFESVKAIEKYFNISILTETNTRVDRVT